MPPPSGQSCANCQYQVLASYPYAGQTRVVGPCHDNPPVADNQWPIVQPGDWCGKWMLSGTPPPPLMPVVSGVADAPAGTASTSGIMMGLGAVTGFSITPIRTGRIVAMITGCCANDSANGGINITGQHGTGNPPANGTAATGMLWSTTQVYYMSNARDIAGFTVVGGNPNLALGVTVWFDLSILATGGGNVTVTNVQCLLFEI